MVSVIIPALNESARIGGVIAHAQRSPLVGEVIVVDDGSIDATGEIARAMGARVILSTLLGKGASLEDGSRQARHDVVLFLDGDLTGLHPDLVSLLCEDVMADRADFVKAKFSREAGRVTILTARPLLQTFFPELSTLNQPLGGLFAVRRSLLEKLTFETDYGVDIGLLIDAHFLGARIVEADIGHLEHESQTLEALGDMAKHVARTILRRAERYGRMNATQLHEVEEIERHSQAEVSVVIDSLGGVPGIALFDMDGTLIQGRFIQKLAEMTGKAAELGAWLDNPAAAAAERTAEIARIFTGVPRDTFIATARAMPLTPGAAQAVVDLKRRGYRVGIVTDSYRIAAEIVRRRVFADFSVAHLLRFADGRATGAVTTSPLMLHPKGCPKHEICKSNVLRHLKERLGVPQVATVSVGDSSNDECLLRASATSVAFEPKSESVARAAQHSLWGSLERLSWLLPELECTPTRQMS